jgi:hypothetical protein
MPLALPRQVKKACKRPLHAQWAVRQDIAFQTFGRKPRLLVDLEIDIELILAIE